MNILQEKTFSVKRFRKMGLPRWQILVQGIKRVFKTLIGNNANDQDQMLTALAGTEDCKNICLEDFGEFP